MVIGGLAIACLLAYVGILPYTDNVENSCNNICHNLFVSK